MTQKSTKSISSNCYESELPFVRSGEPNLVSILYDSQKDCAKILNIVLPSNQDMAKERYCNQLENERSNPLPKNNSKTVSNQQRSGIKLQFATGLIGVVILIL